MHFFFKMIANHDALINVFFFSVLSPSPPGAVHAGQATGVNQTQVKYIEEPVKPRFGGGGVVAHAVIDEPRIGHEQGERYSNL